VATSALRSYEERGLIRSERNAAGHRRYPRAVIRRVAFIIFAQKVGLTIEEIGRELEKLPQNLVPERSDWAKLSGSWTRRIDQRIAELERLRAGLTENASAAAACRLTDAGSRTRAIALLAGDRVPATGWMPAPTALRSTSSDHKGDPVFCGPTLAESHSD
jgi:redox-sensitive transcriptional activator SoxR